MTREEEIRVLAEMLGDARTYDPTSTEMFEHLRIAPAVYARELLDKWDEECFVRSVEKRTPLRKIFS